MKPLHLITREDYSDLNMIDPRTVEERYANPNTAFWLGRTQTWQWDAGDAIVVLTGRNICQPYVVIRVGDTVKALPCGGLKMAMDAMGLDSTEYQTQ